jgi:hypothetical protein
MVVGIDSKGFNLRVLRALHRRRNATSARQPPAAPMASAVARDPALVQYVGPSAASSIPPAPSVSLLERVLRTLALQRSSACAPPPSAPPVSRATRHPALVQYVGPSTSPIAHAEGSPAVSQNVGPLPIAPSVAHGAERCAGLEPVAASRTHPFLIQYVGPSAWAFADAERRAAGLRGYLDRLLVLLPFEVHISNAHIHKYSYTHTHTHSTPRCLRPVDRVAAWLGHLRRAAGLRGYLDRLLVLLPFEARASSPSLAPRLSSHAHTPVRSPPLTSK